MNRGCLNRGCSKKGAALTIVLAVLLAVSFMLAGLMQLPFAASRYTLRRAQITSEAYLAESAFIVHLAGFPQGYFKELPRVSDRVVGPWLELRAGRLMALAGRDRPSGNWPAYADWVDGAEAYRQSLLARIEAGCTRVSGNRRFFKVEPRLRYCIEAGDLTVNADGFSKSASFFVEGSAAVKGNFQVDSLFVFAKGPVLIAGNVHAGWAEIYSDEDVLVEGSAKIRGHIWGRLGTHFSGDAVAEFPSIVLAMGSALSNVSLAGKSKVEGVLAAPNGRVEVGASAMWDSVDALLPFYVRGIYVAFEERVLE